MQEHYFGLHSDFLVLCLTIRIFKYTHFIISHISWGNVILFHIYLCPKLVKVSLRTGSAARNRLGRGRGICFKGAFKVCWNKQLASFCRMVFALLAVRSLLK